jgi:hypothetical protein
MFRYAFVVLLFVATIATSARADTYAEKVKDVDVDKKTITIPVDGVDKTFKVDEKVDVQTQVRVGKRLRLTPVKDGLKGVKIGLEATVTTEKRAGEEVVTKITVLVPEK